MDNYALMNLPVRVLILYSKQLSKISVLFRNRLFA